MRPSKQSTGYNAILQGRRQAIPHVCLVVQAHLCMLAFQRFSQIKDTIHIAVSGGDSLS